MTQFVSSVLVGRTGAGRLSWVPAITTSTIGLQTHQPVELHPCNKCLSLSYPETIQATCSTDMSQLYNYMKSISRLLAQERHKI